MHCKQCGQKLAGGTTVCPNCGSPVKRKSKTLPSILFVFLFVVIVSGALIFLNLKGRGDLPNFSLNSVRSLFSRDAAEAPTATDVPDAEPEATEAPVEEPSATEAPALEEASATEAPGVEEPAATEPPAEERNAAGAPAEAPDAEAEAAAPDEAASTGALALSPMDAYQSLEKANFTRALSLWAACDKMQNGALDQLKQGDAALLLRLCLGQLAGPETMERLVITAGADEDILLYPPLTGAASDASAENAVGKTEYLRAMLASEECSALMQKYFDLLLRNLDTVSLGSGILEAEGILQTYATYQVDLSADTVERIVSSLIGELRWDEQIEQIIRGMTGPNEMDAEERYTLFQNLLDTLDDSLAGNGLNGMQSLRMLMYVDTEGIIRGREITVITENGTQSWRVALPQDGERFGLELRADASRSWELSGRGSLTEGALNGSFRVRGEAESLGRLTAEMRE